MENNEFKKVFIKNRTGYYFYDIINKKDSDLWHFVQNSD